MHHEILINKSKWKPGKNSMKRDFHFNLIDDIILNAIAFGQNLEDTYAKNHYYRFTKSFLTNARRYKKEARFQK